MPREDRMRSLSLLDKDTVNQGEGDAAGIGAELFGMNLFATEENEKDFDRREKRTEAPVSGKYPVSEADPHPVLGDESVIRQEQPAPEESERCATASVQTVLDVSEHGPGRQEQVEPVSLEAEQPDAGMRAAPLTVQAADTMRLQNQPEVPGYRPMEPVPPLREYHEPALDFNRESVPVREPEIPYRYPKLPQPESSPKSITQRMISVYSPKGGVGKSTISKELAVAFSNAVQGRRLKVLIMDADWEFGDVSTLFNVTPRPNVSDWVRDMLADKRHSGHLHLYTSREIEARYIVPYTGNLHILAGPSDPAEAELITEEMVLAIMESLRRTDYDIIIIDSANSNRARTLTPLMKSDAVVLVETLDTSTVAETTAVLNALRSKQFDFNKLYMALNQVPDNDSQIDLSVSEISRLLQLDIAAIIPRYEMVRIINNAGEAAVQKKSTPYSKAIFQLANRIVPIFEEKKKRSLFRFLGLRRGNES